MKKGSEHLKKLKENFFLKICNSTWSFRKWNKSKVARAFISEKQNLGADMYLHRWIPFDSRHLLYPQICWLIIEAKHYNARKTA